VASWSQLDESATFGNVFQLFHSSLLQKVYFFGSKTIFNKPFSIFWVLKTRKKPNS